MEGLGFVEALPHMPQMRGGLIRGISDMVGNKAEADASGCQKIAADNAVAFSLEMLSRYGAIAGNKKENPVYGTILFEGRVGLPNSKIEFCEGYIYPGGVQSGEKGSGAHKLTDNSITIFRNTLDGRYEIRPSFKLEPQSAWSNILLRVRPES
jgi:hypothetical protein